MLYAGDWPRLTPSDFRVRSLDGVADDWPLTYEELEPYYDRIAREVGVSGLAGDPAYPEGADLPLPAAPARGGDHRRRAGPRPARLALVARSERDPVRALPRAPPVRAMGLVHAGLPGGREGVDRHHPLAAGDRAGSPCGHGCARD